MTKRRVTDAESALLKKALDDVRPMKRRPAPPLAAGGKETMFPVRSAAAMASAGLKGKPLPPARDAGDPRLDRSARRGRIEIEGTLDLHGMRQAAAHAALSSFLASARREGKRCVVVVTGKGGAPDPLAAMAGAAPRGIIRARFLEWIEAPSLRAQIARIAPAAPHHGGRGAFYVFLKR